MGAIIFAKTATDKCLILSQRQALIYPFTAPGWQVLRLGMWLSLTGVQGDDDSSANLAESITAVNFADFWWMGLKDNGNNLPMVAGVDYCGLFPGYPNYITELSETSPDTGYRYCRDAPSGGYLPGWGAVISNAALLGVSGGNSPNYRIKFPNVNSFGNGYAAYFCVEVQRDNATSAHHKVAVSAPTDGAGGGGNAGNNVFTSNPTIASLRNNMRTLTLSTQANPGSNLSSANALAAVYLYWPFYNSRLRIHAMCLEKFL